MNTNKIAEGKILGDFIQVPPSKEYLILSFSSGLIPSRQRWRNNYLSADFIANYLSTFFQGNSDRALEDEMSLPEGDIPPLRDTVTHKAYPSGNRSWGLDKQAEVKSVVSYIVNELLENAVKYSTNSSSISIQIHLNPNLIIFQLTNSISLQQTQQFQDRIETLLHCDPNELYITLLERNALNQSDPESGLGFLTMLNDYKAKLGWKFEPQRTEMSVTTMVQWAI